MNYAPLQVYASKNKEITSENARKFISDYLAKKLTGRSLRIPEQGGQCQHIKNNDSYNSGNINVQYTNS